MKEDGDEDNCAKPGRDQETGGDGHTVEKRVDGKTEEDGVARVRVADFLAMSFFAEVKMWRKGVLEEMNEEEPRQDKEQGERVATQANGFRNDFEKGHREHVARTQREKGLQQAARPFAVDDKVAADEIGGGGNQTERGGESGAKRNVVSRHSQRVNQISLVASKTVYTNVAGLTAVAKKNHVTFLHDVLLAFEPNLRFFFCSGDTARGQ